MKDQFDYQRFFDQALSIIKSVRDPRATAPDTVDLKWNEVQQEIIFDFGGSALKKYTMVADAANKISTDCFHSIVIHRMLESGYEVVEVKPQNSIPGVQFMLLDKKAETLLLFKNVEESPFWKNPDLEPDNIRDIMSECEATCCKYIYFLMDKAYLQVVGRNDDETDPGRGFNVYSIKWFFETYFGDADYELFKDKLQKYIQDVNNFIGYSVIKSLTPSSLINFRKVTENELLTFEYETLKTITQDSFQLREPDYSIIKKQFIEEKRFLLMLGNSDFAESFITAEWLYDSMKKSQAIDLSPIAMGYFKSVEQLEYRLFSNHGYPDSADDATLGSLATFYKENRENGMMQEGLYRRFYAQKYIREALYVYANLRNGYSHKDNIHDWNVIDMIRDETFRIIFLILGSISILDKELVELGFSFRSYTDYYKLCEYVNFHHGSLFYLDFGDGNEQIGFGICDQKSKLIDNSYVEYSGVYFKEIRENGRIVPFSEDELPQKITLGKFVFENSQTIKAEPIKVKTIFENGKFVGPSIATEEKLDY